MSEETREENRGQEKGGNKGIIIAAVVIVIVLLAVAIWFLLRKTDKPEEKTKRSVVVTKENQDEILEPRDVTAPAEYIVTMSSSTWQFENGTSPSSNAYVENSKDNKTAVYFDVVRDDTQETIYKSPILPVDSHLSNIILDKDLDAGEYECTLTYYLVDDDQNVLSTLDMWLMVQVAN